MIATAATCAVLIPSCAPTNASSPQAAYADADKYPLAVKYGDPKKQQVISPFRPHNLVDVSGMKSGQLARDPATASVDAKTGKPDINTAKIFRIP